MKFEAAKKNANSIIEECKKRATEHDSIQESCPLCRGNWSECGEYAECEKCKAYTQPVYTHSYDGAKRTLELADMFAKLSEEEKKRLAAHLVFATDYRDCRDIKNALGISWNELRTLADWSRA